MVAFKHIATFLNLQAVLNEVVQLQIACPLVKQGFQGFMCFFWQMQPFGTCLPVHCLYIHAQIAITSLETYTVT